jgi:hypothetical protein
MGGQYIVVGDGGITVTQSEGAIPNILRIERENKRYSVEMTTYTTDYRGLGTIFTPFIGDNNDYFLASGSVPEFKTNKQELLDFLDLETVPVRIGGDLYWSGDETLREDV